MSLSAFRKSQKNILPLKHQDIRNKISIQSNLNSSNSDSSFIVANPNSFLSTYEILPTAKKQKKKKKKKKNI